MKTALIIGGAIAAFFLLRSRMATPAPAPPKPAPSHPDTTGDSTNLGQLANGLFGAVKSIADAYGKSRGGDYGGGGGGSYGGGTDPVPDTSYGAFGSDTGGGGSYGGYPDPYDYYGDVGN